MISRALKGVMSSKDTIRARLKKNDLIKIIAVVLIIATYMTNLSASIKIGRAPGHEPSDAWMQALTWMRYNTPEPFGDVYYKRFVGLLK